MKKTNLNPAQKFLNKEKIMLKLHCESCKRDSQIAYNPLKNFDFDLTSGSKWDTDALQCPICNEWLVFEIAFTQIQAQL